MIQIFFSFPHLGKLLQFQILLLELIATSLICFNCLFLSPPAIPISLRNDPIGAAGNTLHPTSTAHIWTFQPLVFPSTCRGAYLTFFSSPDTSTLSSLATINSIRPILLVLSDIKIISAH